MTRRPSISLFILLFISLFLLPDNLYAIDGFYKYVDANGVIHLTNVHTDRRFRPYNQNKNKERAGYRTSIKRIHDIVERAARKYSVDPNLVKAVIKAESNFDTYAVSYAGAQGLMQLMPATAEGLEVTNPFDPKENIHGGVKYLRWLIKQFKGDITLSVAAYNAGRSKVLEYGGIPPYKQTRTYVKKVLAFYDEYRKNPSRMN